MAKMWKVKTKTKYDVRDAQCIGHHCLVLGMYRRNPCCMTREFSGCPSTEEKADTYCQLASERKADGWRIL